MSQSRARLNSEFARYWVAYPSLRLTFVRRMNLLPPYLRPLSTTDKNLAIPSRFGQMTKYLPNGRAVAAPRSQAPICY